MKMTALIPAYCPDETLLALLKELKQLGFDCLVVDDGSAAGCRGVFQAAEADAVVLHHAENCGKGAALKTGLAWIAAQNELPAAIVTLDADGQHRPEDALRCAETAMHHPDTLVLGCRSFQADVPLRSRLGNKITAGLFALCTGRRISDTQTGLRAFSPALIPLLQSIPGNRYDYEMDVLLACVSRQIPFTEVEIATLYRDNNRGSHFHVLRDSFLIYRQLLKFAASSLTSFLLDYSLFILFGFCFIGSSGVLYANIAARLISATVNYEMNRRYVFADRRSRNASLFKYILLAAFILCVNTAILSLLTDVGHLNPYLAKLLTEAALFLFSWALQKNVIFKTERRIS